MNGKVNSTNKFGKIGISGTQPAVSPAKTTARNLVEWSLAELGSEYYDCHASRQWFSWVSGMFDIRPRSR